MANLKGLIILVFLSFTFAKEASAADVSIKGIVRSDVLRAADRSSEYFFNAVDHLVALHQYYKKLPEKIAAFKSKPMNAGKSADELKMEFYRTHYQPWAFEVLRVIAMGGKGVIASPPLDSFNGEYGFRNTTPITKMETALTMRLLNDVASELKKYMEAFYKTRIDGKTDRRKENAFKRAFRESLLSLPLHTGLPVGFESRVSDERDLLNKQLAAAVIYSHGIPSGFEGAMLHRGLNAKRGNRAGLIPGEVRGKVIDEVNSAHMEPFLFEYYLIYNASYYDTRKGGDPNYLDARDDFMKLVTAVKGYKVDDTALGAWITERLKKPVRRPTAEQITKFREETEDEREDD